VIALNFWRPLSTVIENNPLAVCDARTIEPKDLFETVLYGHGADKYSWHNIGIRYNCKKIYLQKYNRSGRPTEP